GPAHGGAALLRDGAVFVEENVEGAFGAFVDDEVADVLVLEVRDHQEKMVAHPLLGLLELEHPPDVESLGCLALVDGEDENSLVFFLRPLQSRRNAATGSDPQGGTGVEL